MLYLTILACAILICGCAMPITESISGCWETDPNSNGESMAMHFGSDGSFYYPVETSKANFGGGKYILGNRNKVGSWERVNATEVRVEYYNYDVLTKENVLLSDTVVFDSPNSAYFKSIGPGRGYYYRTNTSCNY
jgi:hypothetical protein